MSLPQGPQTSPGFRHRTSVVIVGGGIAGLYCAWELGRRGGYAVTLLEGCDRY